MELKKVIVLLAIVLDLFAAMILNLNVKEKKGYTELLLNFDIPFDGNIVEKRSKDKLILYLEDVKILTPWEKKLDTPYVYQIAVTPAQGGSNVILYTTERIRIKAARSKDGFSLKIKIAPLHPIKQQSKKSDTSGIDWIWVGGGMILVLILLTFAVMFKRSKPRKKVIIQQRETDFSIKFEKPLDQHNKIALISYKGIDYLVLIGSSNVLLGKYTEGEIESQEDFENAIQAQNIDQTPPEVKEDEIFTTIEEYKKKASGKF